MTSVKIQFLVQMTCDSCVKAVKKSLDNVEGVKNVEVDLAQGSVVVDTNLPTLDILKRLESTGKLVAVKGYKGSIAAVSILESGNDSVKGVIRFVQATTNTCIIDGTIDGLRPGGYNIEVHECGDLSRGCLSVGNIFNPANYTGSSSYGALGQVNVERNGRAEFRLENNTLKLSDIIGRSFVVSSQVNGKSSIPISCGIIARSAGLFQNPKTICACDGTTIWDEVSKPNSKSNL